MGECEEDGAIRVWMCGAIGVRYRDSLDGGGRMLAGKFLDATRRLMLDSARDAPFRCAFEWCAGPGFIGYSLLAAGLVDSLVLADVHPQSVECARATEESHGLQQKVRVYESDNLRMIPAWERFDLVIGNPPNYYCINPRHPAYLDMRDDLRPNDAGWRVHRDFYLHIRERLLVGGLVCIQEVDPFATEVFLPSGLPDRPIVEPIPWDIRPRPPVQEFGEMMAEGQLTLLRTLYYPPDHEHHWPIHFLVSVPATTHAESWRISEGVSVHVDVSGRSGSRVLLSRPDGRVEAFTPPVDRRVAIEHLLRLLVSRASTPEELASALALTRRDVAPLLDELERLGWIERVDRG